jgi:hypothetical protein
MEGRPDGMVRDVMADGLLRARWPDSGSRMIRSRYQSYLRAWNVERRISQVRRGPTEWFRTRLMCSAMVLAAILWTPFLILELLLLVKRCYSGQPKVEGSAVLAALVTLFGYSGVGLVWLTL